MGTETAKERKVILFTQPHCEPCRLAKVYLFDKGISFEERDVSEDRQALEDLVEIYGSRTTPTIVIDDEIMMGLDQQRLDEIFG